MIFVTIGTYEAPFDRLLGALVPLADTEELVIQCGHSKLGPVGARWIDFLPFDELAALVKEARVVVTHAGVGSVLVALTAGKRPIVVPRRARYGETVDDHQVTFARRLAEAGLAVAVDDPADVVAAVRAASQNGPPVELRTGGLLQDLARYLRENVPRE
jgi:UDP-N-acetylglucosamine transferase subunit ALG13